MCWNYHLGKDWFRYRRNGSKKTRELMLFYEYETRPTMRI